jgi:rare lipoprotein A
LFDQPLTAARLLAGCASRQSSSCDRRRDERGIQVGHSGRMRTSRALRRGISLRLQPNLYALAAAGGLASTGVAVLPDSAGAQDEPVTITGHRLHVVAGEAAKVDGVLAQGVTGTVQLERRSGDGWHVEDRDRADGAGGFAFAFHPGGPGTSSLRVRVPAPGGAPAETPGTGSVVRYVGRLNVYRRSVASVYGPGLYGTALACGGHLSTSTLGVASKTLRCGAKVTFRHGGRTVRVPVVDRGPYVGGRDWDLTMATARMLGFGYGVGEVLSTA